MCLDYVRCYLGIGLTFFELTVVLWISNRRSLILGRYPPGIVFGSKVISLQLTFNFLAENSSLLSPFRSPSLTHQIQVRNCKLYPCNLSLENPDDNTDNLISSAIKKPIYEINVFQTYLTTKPFSMNVFKSIWN